MVALYYGFFAYARRSVRVAITDGDDDMIAAMAGAFDMCDKHNCMLWGTERNYVLLRRCYFHLFTLNFNAHYKSFKYSDGGIGKDVRKFFVYASHHAETEAEFLHAANAIRKFVTDQDVTTGKFTSAAQFQLMAWLDARMCDYKQFARFIVYGLVDDMETTTNVAESAHHRLKTDPAVNNKSELRILARSDTKAVHQLYTEIKHQHESRYLEVSISNIPIEITARTHLVKHAADDVLKAFEDSQNYKVSACAASEGCALVWRVFPDDAVRTLPFRFNRGPRVLQLNCNNRLNCSCPKFIATQRVCAHILAFNEGDFGVEDVHPRHLKKYYVDEIPDCSSFQGCIARRRADAAFHPLQEHESRDEKEDPNDDQQHYTSNAGPRNKRSHMYTLLTQKSREVIEKWSAVPVVASNLYDLLANFDSEMGDPSSYRIAGAASSRPTPSRGS